MTWWPACQESEIAGGGARTSPIPAAAGQAHALALPRTIITPTTRQSALPLAVVQLQRLREETAANPGDETLLAVVDRARLLAPSTYK